MSHGQEVFLDGLRLSDASRDGTGYRSNAGAQAAPCGRERARPADGAPGARVGLDRLAFKTCKTQAGALLSLCWAKAHDMTLMVQHRANPMLAQIPHVLLAAHAPTIMGVETNSMQLYPEASRAEERVHPGYSGERMATLIWRRLVGRGWANACARSSGTCPRRLQLVKRERQISVTMCVNHPCTRMHSGGE